jgi:predicted enzyme related to lactoylglutathione lyase
MENNGHPTFGNGKICYVELPASDITAAASFYISVFMVNSVADTIELIIKNGGKIVQPPGKDLPEITARFSDPAGNILGLYQHSS